MYFKVLMSHSQNDSGTLKKNDNKKLNVKYKIKIHIYAFY